MKTQLMKKLTPRFIAPAISKISKSLKALSSKIKALSLLATVIFVAPYAIATESIEATFKWDGLVPDYSASGFYLHTDRFFGEVALLDGVIDTQTPISLYVTENQIEPSFNPAKTDAVPFKYTMTSSVYTYTENPMAENPFDVVSFITDYASAAKVEKGTEYDHATGVPLKLSLAVKSAHSELLTSSGSAGFVTAALLIKPNATL